MRMMSGERNPDTGKLVRSPTGKVRPHRPHRGGDIRAGGAVGRRLLRVALARYTGSMTTIRRTYTTRSHNARTRVASVMRKHRMRKDMPVVAPDTRTPLEKRLDEMEREGTLIPPRGKPERLGLVRHIPGALERFLAER